MTGILPRRSSRLSDLKAKRSHKPVKNVPPPKLVKHVAPKVEPQTPELSSYEATRLRNIQSNKELLNTIGFRSLKQPLRAPPNFLKKRAKTLKKPVSSFTNVRRSARINPNTVRRIASFAHGGDKNESKDYIDDLSDHTSDDDSYDGRKNAFNSRKRGGLPPSTSIYPVWTGGKVFGSIPGVPVGALFIFRADCARAGLHAPLVAGISGNTADGCYSIAVSGGYPEDVDEGDRIVFTGSGGRDLKGTKDKPKNLRTAPQTRDMELNRYNKSLVVSVSTGLPIRVIRGPKSHFSHAPIGCYRYDGLYKCVKWSYEQGAAGFKVYRFECVRLPNQEPLESLEREMQ